MYFSQGRQAIEWVIDNIAEETIKLSKTAEEQMDSIKTATLSHIKSAEDTLNHKLENVHILPSVNAETKKL